MGSTRARVWFRRRGRPAPDVGLAAERTAMSWQRTALATAAFSALSIHAAERRLLLAVPGLAGFALVLALLVAGERRYAWTVRRVESGRSPMAPRLNLLLAAGVVVLSVSMLVSGVVAVLGGA